MFENKIVNPSQKSVELCQWVVRHFSSPNSTVLSLCDGSGTVGIAALAEGRNVVACDIEPTEIQASGYRALLFLEEEYHRSVFLGYDGERGALWAAGDQGDSSQATLVPLTDAEVFGEQQPQQQQPLVQVNGGLTVQEQKAVLGHLEACKVQLNVFKIWALAVALVKVGERAGLFHLVRPNEVEDVSKWFITKNKKALWDLVHKRQDELGITRTPIPES
jgi:hypothetical protein